MRPTCSSRSSRCDTPPAERTTWRARSDGDAANRDPERYADPGRFDITRADSRPVTFGGGVHSCIGAALARAEVEIALTTLFGRVPSLHLVEPVCTRFQADNPSVRRPEELLVGV
jgi:cytochrome P450